MVRAMTSNLDQGTHKKAPLTSKEVCLQLDISTRTLARLRKDGHIEFALHRGRIWFTQEAVDAYVNSVFYKGSSKDKLSQT